MGQNFDRCITRPPLKSELFFVCFIYASIPGFITCLWGRALLNHVHEQLISNQLMGGGDYIIFQCVAFSIIDRGLPLTYSDEKGGQV